MTTSKGRSKKRGNRRTTNKVQKEGKQDRKVKKPKRRRMTKRRSKNKANKINIYIALEVAGLKWRTRSPTRSRKRSSCGKKCDSKSCSF